MDVSVEALTIFDGKGRPGQGPCAYQTPLVKLAEHRLLFSRLGSHGSHPWLQNCGPDRARVGCIGLVGLHERPDERGMQDDDLVPERLDLAGPPVCTSTGFLRDLTWPAATEDLDQIIAPKAAVRDLAGLPVDPMQLEDSLRYVKPVRRGAHLRTSDLRWVAVELPLWHIHPLHRPTPDQRLWASSRGGVHTIWVVPCPTVSRVRQRGPVIHGVRP